VPIDQLDNWTVFLKMNRKRTIKKSFCCRTKLQQKLFFTVKIIFVFNIIGAQGAN
jgi:hypothetical protein